MLKRKFKRKKEELEKAINSNCDNENKPLIKFLLNEQSKKYFDKFYIRVFDQLTDNEKCILISEVVSSKLYKFTERYKYTLRKAKRSKNPTLAIPAKNIYRLYERQFNTVKFSKLYSTELKKGMDQMKKEYRELSLPSEVNIPVNQLYLDADDELEDTETVSDIVGDYLADDYGYCINSFKYKIKYDYDENGHKYPKTIKVYKIDWDIGD